jgi:hypothetical protein
MTFSEMLDEADEHGVGLTTWEIEFVESMTKRVANKLPISPAARATLEKIYEERVEG